MAKKRKKKAKYIRQAEAKVDAQKTADLRLPMSAMFK